MKKIISFLILALFITAFLPGCSTKSPAPTSPTPQDTTQTASIKVYFGDAGNEKMVTETRSISYKTEDEKYRLALEELFKGTAEKEHRANIASGVKVYGIIKQGDALIIDLSQEFNRFGGSIAEIIGVGSVVNTLTQFSEIKRVKILVEGTELMALSGLPRGFMTAFPLDPNQTTNNSPKQ